MTDQDASPAGVLRMPRLTRIRTRLLVFAVVMANLEPPSAEDFARTIRGWLGATGD